MAQEHQIDQLTAARRPNASTHRRMLEVTSALHASSQHRAKSYATGLAPSAPSEPYRDAVAANRCVIPAACRLRSEGGVIASTRLRTTSSGSGSPPFVYS